MGGLRLGEVDEYFDPGLTVRVLGVDYVVPPVSAEMGLWCRRLAARAGADVTDTTTGDELADATERVRDEAETIPPPPGDQAETFEERMLGPALRQMIANNVPDPYVQYCAQTAFWRVLGGDRAAELYWTSGGRPQPASPANRKERRAAKKASASPTTSTAAAGTTRTRASGSGTTSRTTSGKSAKPRASRGIKS